MKKYFFFDIDETLLAGGYGRQYVPDSAREALRLLEENGHFVAIATGRSQAMADAIRKDFGIKNMVSDGGNGITIDDKLIGIEPLDREACLALLDECIAKDIPWAFTPDNSTTRLSPDERFMNSTDDVYMKTTTVEGLNPRDYLTFHKVYIACMEGDEGNLSALSGVPWCRYHKEYLFVEPIDKANGIFRMMDLLGGPLEDVVVFGDGLNDMTMFRKEWTSIAMGNAIEDLKKRADFVTREAKDDGIYYACKHFGWI